MGVGLPYTILFVGQDTDKLLVSFTRFKNDKTYVLT